MTIFIMTMRVTLNRGRTETHQIPHRLVSTSPLTIITRGATS